MARIAGLDISGEKKLFVGLTYIYGIGFSLARKICQSLNISENLEIKELNEDQLSQINSYIDRNFVIEGGLRRLTSQNIQRLKDIGSYRGLRHRRGLPVRGQRTRTNARTRKGPRKTVAGKKTPKAPT
jgi:small subunit ribosomal protein S13